MAHISANKKRLDDIEKQSEGIRRDFDQYFLGLIKRPPTTSQAQLAGLFRKMKEEELRDWNTQDKFRFNQIHARFVSMERVWARTLKQIEDGTYRRDKFKVAQMKKRDAAKVAAESAQPAEASPGASRSNAGLDSMDALDSIDVDMGSFDDEQDSRPAPRPAAPRPAPRPAPTPMSASAGASTSALGGVSEQKLQQIHKVYVEAKRRTGEQSTLTVEALRAQMARQVPLVQAKHGCEQVDFKVILKDGKAMLKAIPK